MIISPQLGWFDDLMRFNWSFGHIWEWFVAFCFHHFSENPVTGTLLIVSCVTAFFLAIPATRGATQLAMAHVFRRLVDFIFVGPVVVGWAVLHGIWKIVITQMRRLWRS